MTTYTLGIHQRSSESKLVDHVGRYPSATDALRAFDDWINSGTAVSSIMRDGRPIAEATLRADEEAERTFDVG